MDGKQLKNSILQWAIQGKLVPQNPKDEPAQKLLERIAAARNEYSAVSACHPERSAKGTKSKDLKKKTSKNQPSRIYCENGVWYEQVGSATPKDISDEIPFNIPESWEWVRLPMVGELNRGKSQARPRNDPSLFSNGTFPMIQTGDVARAETVISSCKSKYNEKGIAQSRIWPKGTICLTIAANIGDVAILGFDACFPDSVVGFNAYTPIDSNLFFLYALKCYKNILDELSRSTAQKNINIDILSKIFFPLPPLAEQKRIVAKLEQVLPLAEEYGVAQEQLDKLNKDLPEALKKSILQEAIQGKLVPQNPKDEPAQKLLEKIALSRHSERSEESSKSSKKSSTSLRGAKATKQSKNPPSRIYRENGVWYEQVGAATPKDISDEIPFEIPETWAWCRLGSICDYLHRGKSPVYSDKKILPVMAQKCNQWDKIYTEKCLFADPKTIEKYATEQYLQVGDVIINSTGGGTVGRTGYVDEYVFSEYEKFVADSHVTVVRSNKDINSKYVYYFLITPLIQRGIEERCSGSTNQIELGTETVKNYLFPLPPLAEQKRIIAKLEQLFRVL